MRFSRGSMCTLHICAKHRIMENQDQFVRSLAENLFVYALGRNLELSDRPALDRICTQATERGGGLATLIEQKVEEGMKIYQCAKVTLLASLNGYAPQLAVEFGRKVLFSTERPSFTELDDHVREVKAR